MSKHLSSFLLIALTPVFLIACSKKDGESASDAITNAVKNASGTPQWDIVEEKDEMSGEKSTYAYYSETKDGVRVDLKLACPKNLTIEVYDGNLLTTHSRLEENSVSEARLRVGDSKVRKVDFVVSEKFNNVYSLSRFSMFDLNVFSLNAPQDKRAALMEAKNASWFTLYDFGSLMMLELTLDKGQTMIIKNNGRLAEYRKNYCADLVEDYKDYPRLD